MSTEDLKPNPTSPVTETPAGGMGQPTGTKSKGGAGSKPASPEDLSATIELLLRQNEALTAQNAEMKAKLEAGSPANTDATLSTLATLLAEAIGGKKAPEGPTEADPVNRTEAYNTKNHIDGQSLMEAQAMLLQYRDEPKVPISVPKLLAAYIGPQLAISVNGVRVSIPADGKTYYINETHALAAQERIAKINLLQAKDPNNVIEING